jgi:hypothetical protein
MGQAGGPISRLEKDVALRRDIALQPFLEKLSRLFEGPGAGLERKLLNVT